MNEFRQLPVHPPQETVLSLVKPEAHAEPTDPATDVFTDLRVAPAVVVPADERLQDTRRLMQLAGVRMAFVVNATEGVIGLVTLADLQGERPTLEAQSRLTTSSALAVIDVMTPVSQWTTIDFASLAKAEVGHVVATFRGTGTRYLVVTETLPANADAATGAGRIVIRGLFSANRIERALGHSIEEELRSRNFAELAAALTNV